MGFNLAFKGLRDCAAVLRPQKEVPWMNFLPIYNFYAFPSSIFICIPPQLSNCSFHTDVRSNNCMLFFATSIALGWLT